MDILKLNSFYYQGGYGVYTTAWYTQVLANGGTATAGELSALTTFENSMGANMIEFDRLWIHGLSNSVAARVSFVNPSSTLITEVNSPTFTALQGYTGNGTTSYLNTNYNPSTQGVKYTLNNCSGYAYLLNNNDTGVSYAIFGSRDATNSNVYLIPNSTVVNSIYLANSLNAGGSISTNIRNKLAGVVRNSSLNEKFYINGSLTTTSELSSSALASKNIYLLATNDNSSANRFTNGSICFSAFGSGQVNQLNFYNEIQALGTTLGWAV